MANVALLAAGALTAPAAARAQAGAAVDRLPDVMVDADVLGEIRIDTTTIPGHRLLRLSASTPNIGQGRLEIRADLSGVVDPTQPSPVLQRIYRSDGTFWDRPAGSETFDAEHGHVHFDTWAQYRLRALAPDGSAGPVVAQSNKTSFCLLDLVAYDMSNPFVEIPGHYLGCGYLVQGITPGWADVYDLEVPAQWIDITGIADGAYWLEAEVDPDDRILELDETNNVARIRVDTRPPPAAGPDIYEDNDDLATVGQRAAGGPGSPNLGPITAPRALDALSMEDGSDVFAFSLTATADGGFVRIESPFLGSDMDLVVLDGAGNILGASTTLGNFEQVSIDGAPAGDYYAWVVGNSAPNPSYRLAIDPGLRPAPRIVLTGPAEPGPWIERAFESVPVTWTTALPAGAGSATVALAIDRDQIADKQTQRLPAYQALDAAAGAANILTEGLGLGRWFVYAQISDGHGVGSSWAPAPFFIYVKGDLDFDGDVDLADWRLARQTLAPADDCDDREGGGALALWRAIRRALERGRLPAGWDRVLDLDRDGALGLDDVRALRRLIAAGHHAR